MNMSSMTVGKRLSLGFGLILLLLIGTTILSIVKLGDLNDKIEKITKQDWVKAKLANAALDNARGSIARVFQLTSDPDKEHLNKAKERLATNTKVFNESLEKMEGLLYLAEGKALLAKSKEAGAKYVASYSKVLALVDEGKREEAVKMAYGETYNALQVFATSLREMADFQQKLVDSTAEESDRTYAAGRNLTLTIGVLAVLIGVAAAALITRSLLKQLGCEPSYAANIAGQIASGNLAVAIDTKPNDHQSLLFAIKAMRDSLANIVSQVRVGTDTIATASGQIAAGNQDLSSRTEQQAGSLEETASSMEELASTVKQNADNARQADQLAMSASEVAAKGGAVVSQVVETMSSINESSKKIVDIISVIDGIAFQTNILALNAAVEAARAGEQGRGFAVVAAEVRSLAQRSASAAKEIKTLINNSVGKVGIGAKLVDQAGATMEELVASVKRVTDIMGEITAASQEQHAGITQINDAINQMDEITQQNAALVEQAAAAAASMQEQAGNLSQVVGVFRLDNTYATAAPANVAVKAASAPRAMAKVKKVSAHAPVDMARARNLPKATANEGWEEF